MEFAEHDPCAIFVVGEDPEILVHLAFGVELLGLRGGGVAQLIEAVFYHALLGAETDTDPGLFRFMPFPFSEEESQSIESVGHSTILRRADLARSRSGATPRGHEDGGSDPPAGPGDG